MLLMGPSLIQHKHEILEFWCGYFLSTSPRDAWTFLYDIWWPCKVFKIQSKKRIPSPESFQTPVSEMASMPYLQTLLSAKPTATVNRSYFSCTSSNCESAFLGSKISLRNRSGNQKQRPATVVAAFGDVSSDGTTYLIAGAAAVALLGTAFPVLFSRKDL